MKDITQYLGICILLFQVGTIAMLFVMIKSYYKAKRFHTESLFSTDNNRKFIRKMTSPQSVDRLLKEITFVSKFFIIFILLSILTYLTIQILNDQLSLKKAGSFISTKVAETILFFIFVYITKKQYSLVRNDINKIQNEKEKKKKNNTITAKHRKK